MDRTGNSFRRHRVYWLAFITLSSLIGYTFADCVDLTVNRTIDVSEDVSVGHVVATVVADSLSIKGTNLGDAYKSLLKITQKNQQFEISINEPLDAEKDEYVVFTFLCKDKTSNVALTDDVFLVIQDVNEMAPRFTNLDLTADVHETAKIGTTVYTVSVVDDDATKVTQFIFDIVNGSDGYFEINAKYSATGNIVLNKSLDYEEGPRYFLLNISATEFINGLTTELTNYTIITINVVDDDDLMPEFLDDTYTLSIPEKNYTGNLMFQTKPALSAKDGDLHLNTTIQFRIGQAGLSHSKNNLFSVSPDGLIGVNGNLDVGTYVVLVEAYQTDNPTMRYSSTFVTVTVTDVNDHKPVMSDSSYTVNVSESALPGTILLTVSATDEDMGNNSVIKFDISDLSGFFRVETHGHFGTIQLVSSLDYENETKYLFQVWAEETMTVEHFKSTPSDVIILVTDENDNSPLFTESQYRFNVTRTHRKGDVVGQVSAVDIDAGVNRQVTYRFQLPPSVSSPTFEINNNTGEITLAKDLDYSDVGSHSLIVKATDGAAKLALRRTSFAQVIIDILPVSTNPPIFLKTTYLFNVSETAAVDTLVGQVTAVDQDGDKLRYSMTPTSRYIALNESSGEMTVKETPDLDSTSSPAPKEIFLKVNATDGNSSATADVKVVVLHENEYAPKFIVQQGPVSVFENVTNGTLIATVKATDKDNGPDGNLTYTILPSATSGLFTVDPSTGQIRITCSSCLHPDRGTYDIAIQAADGGSPPLHATVVIQLEVNKTVYDPPRFSQNVYPVILAENQPAQAVLQLAATDSDTPQSQLVFGVQKVVPASASSLLVVCNNGTVYINQSLDAESIMHFVIDVTVTDGHSADYASVDVNITDVNEFSPVLNAHDVLLPENTKPGTLVAVINATDEDATNSGFFYFLTDDTEADFRININTGRITLVNRLDRKQKSNYNITVTVQDYGVPPRFTSRYFVVNVTDSNTAPHFVDNFGRQVSSYTFTVKENASIGDLIGSLSAQDPDDGSSGHLTFHLQPGNSFSLFSLDTDTGNLKLTKMLNYKLKQEHFLTAVVSDSSYEPKSATASVTIHVEEVKKVPVWPSPLPAVYIIQTAVCKNQTQWLLPISDEVTTVFSYSEPPARYDLLNVTDTFSIDNRSGLIRVNKTLTAGSHVLWLQACITSGCSDAALTVLVQNKITLAFCPSFYRVEVNESANINFTILDMNTTRPNSSVQYYISNGNTDNTFQIGANDGRLYVTNKLDREKTTGYTLIISAEDVITKELAEAQVIIKVLDAQDEPPRFSSTTYWGQVRESQLPSSPVYVLHTDILLVVSATDSDENPQLTYSIDSAHDTSNGSFSVNSQGGVYLAKSIDYELIPVNLNKTFIFTVLVTDGLFTNSALVFVKVEDDNDMPPIFDDPKDLHLSVVEGPLFTAYLTTIHATDPDTNTRLEYSLNVISPPVGATQFFYIDTFSGDLRVMRDLDREAQDKYILNITVTDGIFTISKLATVTVADINDNSPQFNQTFNMTVVEGSAGVGTNISVSAYDDDIGLNASLKYYVISGNIGNSFVFIKNILKTVNEFDREAPDDANFTVAVIAVDGGQPSRTGTGTVFVTVKDINDNPPKFSETKYYASVREDAFNVKVPLIPSLNVTNLDVDDCPGYNFSLSDSSSPFSVDESSGALFVTGKLDREAAENYTILITAVDDCGEGLNSSAEIFIEVTDYDEPPYFLQDVYNFSISTNTSSGQIIGTVTAKDDSISSFVTYSMTRSIMFYIDHLTGNIRLMGDLNTDNTAVYTLTVSACDANSNCNSTTVNIFVTDRCPVWNITSVNLTVKEGQHSGTIGHMPVLYSGLNTVASVSYILNDTGVTFIKINNKSGEVILQAPLKADKSRQNIFSFTVYFQDNVQTSCVQSGLLTITLIEQNDHYPEICYHGNCGVSDIEVTVYDKSQAGTFIALINTRDNDTGLDGQVTLSLNATDNRAADLFSLNNLTGVITLRTFIDSIDLKSKGIVLNNTIDLFLVAEDCGQDKKSTNASIKVKIIDSPTDVLHFTNQNYYLTVAENENAGNAVGKVTASANATAVLTYSLSPLGSLPFTIDSQSGIITTTEILDREQQQSYLFTAHATTPSQHLTASTLVSVTVEDVNEPPKFDMSVITVTAPEETAPLELTAVTAHDDDLGANGTVMYSIVNASSYPNFMVNQTSGVLSVATALDRENVSSYNLIIQAVDGGNPQLSVLASVQVTVSDINDNRPEFILSDFEYNVSKSELPQKIIATVKATDADKGVNKKIIYSLESDLNAFTIDPLSGDIQAFKVPNAKTYNLVVVATDQGFPPLNNSVSIAVTVQDDRTYIEPILTLSAKVVTLLVSMRARTQLNVNINTVDVDSLHISGGNGTNIFTIENEKIFLNQDLTLETVYILTITATSPTGHNVSRELEIHVIGIKFSQQTYAAVVPENSNGQVILDIDSNAEQIGVPIIYSLVAKYSAFYINSSTGVLWVLEALDREEYPVYELNVSLSLDHLALSGHTRHKRAAYADQAFASVLVRVADTNDNPPRFDNLGPNTPFSVSADVNVSHLITTLKAVDPDEGLNGLIWYSISPNDTDAFDLNPITGDLTVASPEKLREHSSFLLTVKAADRNGTGIYSTVDILISIVQDDFQFRLSTPLPLATLKENWPAILKSLTQILGLSLSIDELTVHEESGNVYQDRSDILFRAILQPNVNKTTYLSTSEIGKKLSTHLKEIEALFDSYMVQPEAEKDDDSMNAISIALIAVACCLFIFSVVAVIISYRMWKKQKKYEKKFEDAEKVRHKIEKESKFQTMKEIKTSSDPEHLEMNTVTPSSFVAEIEDPAADDHLENIQQLLQVQASDTTDSGIASPVSSDSDDSKHESPSSFQKSNGNNESSSPDIHKSDEKNESISPEEFTTYKGEISSSLLDRQNINTIPDKPELNHTVMEELPTAGATTVIQEGTSPSSSSQVPLPEETGFQQSPASIVGPENITPEVLTNQHQDKVEDSTDNSSVPAALPYNRTDLSFGRKSLQNLVNGDVNLDIEDITYF